MTLQGRLKRIVRRGNINVANLALILGRPDPTVRSWIAKQKKPHFTALELGLLSRTLQRLERHLEKGPLVPIGASRKERKAALKQLRR